MRVRIQPLGEAVITVEDVAQGTTIGEILDSVNISVNGRSILLNNQSADITSEVRNGTDANGNEIMPIIVLAQKMKGGR